MGKNSFGSNLDLNQVRTDLDDSDAGRGWIAMAVYANMWPFIAVGLQVVLLTGVVVFWSELPRLDMVRIASYGFLALLCLLLVRKRSEYMTDAGFLALRWCWNLMWIPCGLLLWVAFVGSGSVADTKVAISALGLVVLLPMGCLMSFERVDHVSVGKIGFRRRPWSTRRPWAVRKPCSRVGRWRS